MSNNLNDESGQLRDLIKNLDFQDKNIQINTDSNSRKVQVKANVNEKNINNEPDVNQFVENQVNYSLKTLI